MIRLGDKVKVKQSSRGAYLNSKGIGNVEIIDGREVNVRFSDEHTQWFCIEDLEFIGKREPFKEEDLIL
jgi:hypothetical protein